MRVDFDRRLKLEFHGSKITSDAGLLAYRELDDVLGLTDLGGAALSDLRRGKNTRHLLTGLLSCPDLESICKAYVEDRCTTIDRGLKRHWPHAFAKGFPTQHRINFFFHQWGKHRNLYDLEMVTWALHNAGFKEVQRVSEADLIRIYPEIPPRENDKTSLIVSALRG